VLPRLPADRDKLTQVLVNLLDNAIKYSPDGGDVVVGARTDGERMYLWVRDHGLGIPPDALETVFERYTRIESAQHQLIRGTGLGLPIARNIFRAHGGDVVLRNRPGGGLLAVATLPG
jgi:signal transduction histidine kinase